MIKLILFTIISTTLVNGQGFDPRCGPPRPVAPGFEDSFIPRCPPECPEGEICCPLGIPGTSCFPIPPNSCPDGLDQVFCIIPPCTTERCPRFPDAQCSDDFCGDCNAVFTNTTTQEVIPRFSCDPESRWPACLEAIFCPRPSFDCSTGCPRVPDAVCNLNCDCNFIFSDRRTGATLSAEECGREFDERCPPVPFRGQSLCTTCPRKCTEEQICCPNGCFGGPTGSSCISIPAATCPAIRSTSFISSCTTSNNGVGSECLFRCSADQFLIGTRRVECQENGEWSPDFEGTRCINSRDLDSRCPAVHPIRPANCPICPLTCPTGQICCPTGCPAATTCIDIPEPSCPANLTRVQCFDSPCRTARCPRFPDAVCTDDFCGACNAVFTDPESGNVIPKFSCPRSNNWPGCLAAVTCLANPPINCDNGCPSKPDAVCSQNCDCSLVFTDRRTGNVFNTRECGRRVTCPGLEPSSGLTATCTNGYNYGSRCFLRCPPGQRRVSHPFGHTCLSSGRWVPAFDRVRCTPVSPPSGTCQRINRSNMHYFCRHSTRIGFFCSIRCDSGYELRGNRYSRCIKGRFTPSIGNNRCVRRTSLYRPCSSCGKK